MTVPPVPAAGNAAELEAWIDQIAAELDRLQSAVEASPDGEHDVAPPPELEAAVGRAYLALGQSGTQIEERARHEAAAILLSARAEAAELVEQTRQDLEELIQQARQALRTLFAAAGPS